MQEVYTPYCSSTISTVDKDDEDAVLVEKPGQDSDEHPRAVLLTVYIEEAHAKDEWYVVSCDIFSIM